MEYFEVFIQQNVFQLHSKKKAYIIVSDNPFFMLFFRNVLVIIYLAIVLSGCSGPVDFGFINNTGELMSIRDQVICESSHGNSFYPTRLVNPLIDSIDLSLNKKNKLPLILEKNKKSSWEEAIQSILVKKIRRSRWRPRFPREKSYCLIYRGIFLARALL